MVQFRRRASAVPNSIAIWFEYDTAEKQLWFRRRARIESNLEFTDASQNSPPNSPWERNPAKIY